MRSPAGLSHVDRAGRIRMVDVSEKAPTAREAIARGYIAMSAEALRQVRSGGTKKGDALETARLAGIMAAKQTATLIPLCHPLPIRTRTCRVTPARGRLRDRGARADYGSTGVEMEALTAVSVAALTVYDMVKAVDKGMVIGEIRLIEKTGGKSGTWKRGRL
jgi:cyclic pyranopterin phosphate synthase